MKEKYAIFFAEMTASGWAELAETLMKDSRNQRSKESSKEVIKRIFRTNW